MDNEMAVMVLVDFLNESEEPQAYWPQHWFEEVSFTRWAAGELITAIMDRPFAPAVDTIEEFAIKMVCYQDAAADTKAEKIFKYAAEFACEALDFFREEYGNT